MQNNQLCNTGQLARHLRVRASWIIAEAEAGRIPHVRVGDGFMFDVLAVEAALLKRASKPVTFMDAAREIAAEQKNGGGK